MSEPEVEAVRVWSRQESADESRHYYGETDFRWLTEGDDLSDLPDTGWDSLDFNYNNYIAVTYYCRCSGIILDKMHVSGGTPSYDLKIYQDGNSSFRRFVILIEIPKEVSLYTSEGDIFRSYTGETYDYDVHPSPIPFENS